MQRIAAKLTEKTHAGELSWQTANAGTSFHASYSTFEFLVSCVPSGPTRTPSIMFAVMDPWGFELDRLEHDTPRQLDHPEVQDLYRTAKHQALGIEEKLNELLKGLDEQEFKDHTYSRAKEAPTASTVRQEPENRPPQERAPKR